MLILVDIKNRTLDPKTILEMVIADRPRGVVPLNADNQPLLVSTGEAIAAALDYGRRLRALIEHDGYVVYRGWGESGSKLSVRYLREVNSGTSLHLLEIQERQGVGADEIRGWFEQDYPAQGIDAFEVSTDGLQFSSSTTVGFVIGLTYFGELNGALYFMETIQKMGQSVRRNLYKYWPGKTGRFDVTITQLAKAASQNWGNRVAQHGSSHDTWNLTE